MDSIEPGEFVQMNGDRAKTAGLVYRIASGKAHVWWCVREGVIGKEHPVSDLKRVGKGTFVPDSMMMLRSENFPNKAFRIRLS